MLIIGFNMGFKGKRSGGAVLEYVESVLLKKIKKEVNLLSYKLVNSELFCIVSDLVKSESTQSMPENYLIAYRIENTEVESNMVALSSTYLGSSLFELNKNLLKCPNNLLLKLDQLYEPHHLFVLACLEHQNTVLKNREERPQKIEIMKNTLGGLIKSAQHGTVLFISFKNTRKGLFWGRNVVSHDCDIYSVDDFSLETFKKLNEK